MKNTFKFYAIATLFVVLAVSCKKKSSEDITSLPYAKESIEEGKTNLETTGQNMVSELSTLSDAKGMSASQSLGHFMDLSDPFSNTTQSARVFASVKAINTYGSSKNVNSLVHFLSTQVQDTQDTTLKQVIARYQGVYTWDKSTSTWVKTAATGTIELVFPATETGTTNNAKLDITYASQKAPSSIPGINGDLPTLFDVALSVDNEKVMEYSFTAQYNSDGTPNNVSTFIALYPFKFEVTAKYNSSSASLQYLFTDNTTTIFDLFGQVNGNLSQNNLETAQSPDNVISNANAYIQVFNIKLAGLMDFKSLYNKENEIYSKDEADSLRIKEEVAAQNQYVKLVLMYADTKQKIAQAEFYAVKHVYDYGYGYSYIDYSSDIRFIFSDGSKGSLESYFSTGFSNVVADFNTLLVKLNGKFGTDMGPVSY